MTVTLNQAALSQLLTGANGPVDSHCKILADLTRVRAFAYAPKGLTNNLANSITEPQRESDGSWTVTATASYAAAVEQGAQQHIVAPRNANALHFNWAKRGGIETIVPKAGGFTTNVTAGILWIGKGFVVIPASLPQSFMQRALEATINS